MSDKILDEKKREIRYWGNEKWKLCVRERYARTDNLFGEKGRVKESK